MLGLLGFGVQAQRYLATDDPDELLALTALCEAAIRLDEIRMHNQAVHVVNQFGKSMRR